MKRKHRSPEQIMAMLRDAEADQVAGLSIEQVCNKLGASEQTYFLWNSQYGSAKADRTAASTTTILGKIEEHVVVVLSGDLQVQGSANTEKVKRFIAGEVGQSVPVDVIGF